MDLPDSSGGSNSGGFSGLLEAVRQEIQESLRLEFQELGGKMRKDLQEELKVLLDPCCSSHPSLPCSPALSGCKMVSPGPLSAGISGALHHRRLARSSTGTKTSLTQSEVKRRDETHEWTTRHMRLGVVCAEMRPVPEGIGASPLSRGSSFNKLQTPTFRAKVSDKKRMTVDGGRSTSSAEAMWKGSAINTPTDSEGSFRRNSLPSQPVSVTNEVQATMRSSEDVLDQADQLLGISDDSLLRPPVGELRSKRRAGSWAHPSPPNAVDCEALWAQPQAPDVSTLTTMEEWSSSKKRLSPKGGLLRSPSRSVISASPCQRERMGASLALNSENGRQPRVDTSESHRSSSAIPSSPFQSGRSLHDSPSRGESKRSHTAFFLEEVQREVFCPQKVENGASSCSSSEFDDDSSEGERGQCPVRPESPGKKPSCSWTAEPPALYRATSEADVSDGVIGNGKRRLDFKRQATKAFYDMKDWTVYGMCQDVVRSSYFDYIVTICILLNAITIGVQADFSAKHVGQPPDRIFKDLERVFCACFTTEIVLRLYVLRQSFFVCSGWKWNWFDLMVVVIQLAEELLDFIINLAGLDGTSSGLGSGSSVIRVLRVLRLIRIVRLVRVFRLISELRTIVSSILGTMRSLCWTCVLLFVMTYIVGVYITQLSADTLEGIEEEVTCVMDREACHINAQSMSKYYGTLSRSLLSLFQGISGGVDWDELADPLIMHSSPLCGLFFSIYIAFSVLAVFNVVTGIFVETALIRSKEDKDVYMVNQLRRVLIEADVDTNGMISWEEFESQLENTELQEYFKAIDVDVSEAKGLFRLLDISDSGEILAEEFLSGCIRLRGPAKALDMQILLHQTRQMSQKLLHMKEAMPSPAPDVTGG